MGHHWLNITIADPYSSQSYFMNFEVVNTAPYFSKFTPSDQSVPLNNPLFYRLPEMKDDEDN